MIAARSDADPRRYVAALARIGRHADTAILRSLSEGPRRFNEIASELAHVGEEELGGGLRELDAGGLVARRVDPGPAAARSLRTHRHSGTNLRRR